MENVAGLCACRGAEALVTQVLQALTTRTHPDTAAQPHCDEVLDESGKSKRGHGVCLAIWRYFDSRSSHAIISRRRSKDRRLFSHVVFDPARMGKQEWEDFTKAARLRAEGICFTIPRCCNGRRHALSLGFYYSFTDPSHRFYEVVSGPICFYVVWPSRYLSSNLSISRAMGHHLRSR